MSKFELSVYNAETGDVEKILKRNFMPVTLYIKFQKLAEKAAEQKIESDEEIFFAIKELFLETFRDLTEDEYLNQTDTSEVLTMFDRILKKSTEISGNSKNE